MATVGSIVYSKLAESIQLKKLYLIAVVIFALFSILGYFSSNIYLLILCRIAQGVGGAAFISLTMVAVMDVLDRRLLPIGLAFISFAMALGSGLGPLLSGILLYITDWHFLFLFIRHIGTTLYPIINKEVFNNKIFIFMSNNIRADKIKKY